MSHLYKPLIILFLLLIGCSFSNPFDNSIKIGINIEETGVYEAYGNSFLKGVNLAVNDINQKGGIKGRKIKLVTADNKSDPSLTSDNLDFLTQKKRVSAILGSTVTVTNISAAAKAEKIKIPLVTSGTLSPVVTYNGKIRNYVYSTGYNEKVQSEALASYARKKLKKRNAYVFYKLNDLYGQLMATSFKKAFQAVGGKVFIKNYSTDKDFKATIDQIKISNNEILFLPVYYPESGALIKITRDWNKNIPIFGSDCWDLKAFDDEMAKSGIDEIYFTTQAYLSKNGHRSQVFIRDFKALYKQSPDIVAALGYDNTVFLLEAIKEASGESSEEINKMINKKTSFTGVTGDISVTANDKPGHMVMQTYKSGQKVMVGVIYQQ